MSTDVVAIVEGDGAAGVPTALGPEGDVYGRGVPVLLAWADALCSRLGVTELSGFVIDTDTIADEVADALEAQGLPVVDEPLVEERQAEFELRAPMYPAAELRASVDAILSWLLADEERAREQT